MKTTYLPLTKEPLDGTKYEKLARIKLNAGQVNRRVKKAVDYALEFCNRVIAGNLPPDTRKDMYQEMVKMQRELSLSSIDGDLFENDREERMQMCGKDVKLPEDVFSKLTTFELTAVTGIIVCHHNLTRSLELSSYLGMTLDLSSRPGGGKDHYTTCEDVAFKSAEDLKPFITELDAWKCEHTSIFELFAGKNAVLDGIMGPVWYTRQETPENDKLKALAIFSVSFEFLESGAFGKSMNRYVLFYCNACGVFGLYNTATGVRVPSTDIEQLIRMVLVALESRARTISKSHFFNLLRILLCLWCAYNANLPPYYMPDAYGSQIDQCDRAIQNYIEGNNLKDDNHYTKLLAIFPLMGAMIFMKRNIHSMQNYECMVYYLTVMDSWIIQEGGMKPAPGDSTCSSLVDSDFLSLKVTLADSKDLVKLSFSNLDNVNVYLREQTWYAEPSADFNHELSFCYSICTIDAINGFIATQNFRSTANLSRVMDLIISYFIMLFMIIQWTQGKYLAAIKWHFEVFKDRISFKDSENFEMRYRFSSPTYSDLGILVQSIYDYMLATFVSKGTVLIGWQNLYTFITYLYNLKIEQINHYLGVSNNSAVSMGVVTTGDFQATDYATTSTADFDDLDSFMTSCTEIENSCTQMVEEDKNKTEIFKKEQEDFKKRKDQVITEMNEKMAAGAKLIAELRTKCSNLEGEIAKKIRSMEGLTQKELDLTEQLTSINKRMEEVVKKKVKLEQGLKQLKVEQYKFEQQMKVLNNMKTRMQNMQIQIKRFVETKASQQAEITETQEAAMKAVILTTAREMMIQMESGMSLQDMQAKLQNSLNENEAKIVAKTANIASTEKLIQTEEIKVKQAETEVEQKLKECGQNIINVQAKMSKAIEFQAKLEISVNNLVKQKTDLENDIRKNDALLKKEQEQRDIHRKAATDKLAELMSIRRCAASPATTPSVENLIFMVQQNKYYNMPTYVEINDKIENVTLFVTGSGSAHQLEIRNGLTINSPAYKTDDIAKYLEQYAELMLKPGNDLFILYYAALTLINLGVVLYYKDQQKFDTVLSSVRLKNTQDSWLVNETLDKIKGFVQTYSNQANVNLKVLVACYDTLAANARRPHVHCNMPDCKEESIVERPSKLEASKADIYHTFVYGQDKTAHICINKDGQIYLMEAGVQPGREKSLAYAETAEIQSYMVEHLTSNTSATIVLFALYYYMACGLQPTDARVTSMETVIEQMIDSATGDMKLVAKLKQWYKIDASKLHADAQHDGFNLPRHVKLGEFRIWLFQLISALRKTHFSNEIETPQLFRVLPISFTYLTRKNMNVELREVGSKKSLYELGKSSSHCHFQGRRPDSTTVEAIEEDLDNTLESLNPILNAASALMVFEQILIMQKALQLLDCGKTLSRESEIVKKLEQYSKQMPLQSSADRLKLYYSVCALAASKSMRAKDMKLESVLDLFYWQIQQHHNDDEAITKLLYDYLNKTESTRYHEPFYRGLKKGRFYYDIQTNIKTVGETGQETEPTYQHFMVDIDYHHNKVSHGPTVVQVDEKQAKERRLASSELDEEILLTCARLLTKLYTTNHADFVEECVILGLQLACAKEDYLRTIFDDITKEIEKHFGFEDSDFLKYRLRIVYLTFKYVHQLRKDDVLCWQQMFEIMMATCITSFDLKTIKESSTNDVLKSRLQYNSCVFEHNKNLYYLNKENGQAYWRFHYEKNSVNVYQGSRSDNGIQWAQKNYQDLEMMAKKYMAYMASSEIVEFFKLVLSIVCHVTAIGTSKEYLELVKLLQGYMDARMSDQESNSLKQLVQKAKNAIDLASNVDKKTVSDWYLVYVKCTDAFFDPEEIVISTSAMQTSKVVLVAYTTTTTSSRTETSYCE
ncbi:Collectin-12 [Cichlidogyrus casuarinus]|uniref:Collectin-12 n=1 Tax=Cichlidogyrus casuarinus TaxID=1844966 RepID=A0ABD2PUL0_9PLAT